MDQWIMWFSGRRGDQGLDLQNPLNTPVSTATCCSSGTVEESPEDPQNKLQGIPRTNWLASLAHQGAASSIESP